MNRWSEVTGTVATRGGAIIILLLINITGWVITIHLIHHGEASTPVAASLISTFSGFSGALLLALKGSSETSASATSGPSGSTASVSDSAARVAAPPASDASGSKS
jgi:hypothetical protein